MKLYAVFHLNLAYSSIEEEQRHEVIHRCYWPLLRLAREHDLPLGIEASGYTIETANAIDPDWLNELRSLTRDGPCEFIGSGYTQIIGPLVPAKVNDWNQKLGLEIYEKYLDVKPQIALVNEMAYSSGIVEHYLNNGYKAIIMEWNNPRKYHSEWKNEWRYFPQLIIGVNGRKIPVIWADSIAFQKFQRYAQGEIYLNEFIKYLEKHENDPKIFFPLYVNDVEIFDYRPECYKTEPELKNNNEWERIRELFIYLQKNKKFQIISPSEVLNGLNEANSGKLIRLESAEQPIPVKKQEKYNINRWALTGRDDLGINTECYYIYSFLNKNRNKNPEDWKKLCYFWSSDFRTHITEKRWIEYLKRLNHFHNIWNDKKNSSLSKEDERIIKVSQLNKHYQCVEDERHLIIETDFIKCIFSKLRGLAIRLFWFKNISGEPLFGTLEHGYYDDISLGADFYSCHTIIERAGEHKITDLMVSTPELLSNDDLFLIIRTRMNTRNITFKKEYCIYFQKPCLEIKIEIHMPRRDLDIIHPMNITFIPNSFDRNSLFYATNNGGLNLEKFKIGKNVIYHAQNYSPLISAKHGLGASEGIVVIGDKKIQISVHHDQTRAALIPYILFLPLNNGNYFLRLQYSAQEIDETFVKDEMPYNLISKFIVEGD